MNTNTKQPTTDQILALLHGTTSPHARGACIVALDATTPAEWRAVALAECAKQPKNVARFDYWFNSDGHWIYPSRERALTVWLSVGIESLPAPIF